MPSAELQIKIGMGAEDRGGAEGEWEREGQDPPLLLLRQMYRRGFQRGKRRECRSTKNPIRFPLWPSGESGQAVCGALCAPRRQAARCPQTAAHAYAPLALPLAARSNAAIREVPGGSLDTFSPERKYHAPYALHLRRKTDSACEPKASDSTRRRGGERRMASGHPYEVRGEL